MSGDNLAAARRFKKKFKDSKPSELEVRAGDMVVNDYGYSMIITRVMGTDTTLKESVEYVETSYNSEGAKTMTLEKLRKMHRQGKYTIHRGPAWKGGENDSTE